MEKSKLKAIRSKETIVLALDGDTINIQKKSNPELFEEIDALMREENLKAIEVQFADIKKRVENYTKGVFTVHEGKVMLKGDKVEMPKAIVKKLMELEREKADFLPLLRFWRKLKDNPSKNSREQLYSYMMANKMSITEQGDIVFEKGVNKKRGGAPDQLVDGHTGDVDHSIGMVVEMPREAVNDDPHQTCSRGLHCAPPEYVRQHYSNNVIIEVIVNPKDVVSVPVDYNQTKVRVCRLQVMGYASKTPRAQQVVSLTDFLQDMPEEYKGTREKEATGNSTVGTKSTKNTHTIKGSQGNLQIEVTDAEEEIKGKTAKEIIEYVKLKTGEEITIQLKNKNGIIKKAIEILTKYNDEKAKLMEKEVHELGQGVDTTVVDGMTAKEVLAYIKETYDVDLSHINVKNKTKIVKEAKKVIETRAVAEVAKSAPDETKEFAPDTEDTVVEENTEETSAPEVEEEKPQETRVEDYVEKAPEITLSKMSRNDLIKECKTRFNEKVGGLFVSDEKVLTRATKLFEDAGYIVK